MAIGPYTDSVGTYVVVSDKYDCLTVIAVEYKNKGTSGYGDWQRIATLNNISGPNYTIQIGDKIYLQKNDTSDSTNLNGKHATIKYFGPKTTGDNDELLVTWEWATSETTEKFKVVWYYLAPGTSTTRIANSHDISVDDDFPDASKQDTQSIPENATSIWVTILPVAKDEAWTAEKVTSKVLSVNTLTPDPPSTPDIDLEDLTITVTLDFDNLDSRLKYVNFRLVRDHNESSGYVTNSGDVAIKANHASYVFSNLKTGSEYKVQARFASTDTFSASKYSNYSTTVTTRPSTPLFYSDYCRASDETEVYLEWRKSPTAETYEIQYVTDKDKFDVSGEVTSENTSGDLCYYYVQVPSSGDEYYFRVRAVDGDQKSEWSNIISVVVGSTPAAPTTWSSSTTVVAGEDLYLYWQHNSKDGSYESYAFLTISPKPPKADGAATGYMLSDSCTINVDIDLYPYWFIKYTALTEEEKKEGVAASCLINTSLYEDGTEFTWCVSTAGVTQKPGEASTVRTVKIYAQPTIDLAIQTVDLENTTASEVVYTGLSLVDAVCPVCNGTGVVNDEVCETCNGTGIDSVRDVAAVTSFPFYVYAQSGPESSETQNPLEYYVTVVSKSYYETVDNVGNDKIVSPGDTIYAEHFDSTSYEFRQKFTPADLSLENGCEYTITCSVFMNSGLSATSSVDVVVDWEPTYYSPNAEIAIDTETMSATVRPYCLSRAVAYHVVNYNSASDTYVKSNTSYGFISGITSRGATSVTTPMIISEYGTSLDIDVGSGLNDNLTTTTTYYLLTLTEDGVTTETSGWSTTKQTPTVSKPVLWCYQETKYTDNPPKTEPDENGKSYTVYSGTTVNGDTCYYCIVEKEVTDFTDITMSVYRREFDGSFVEIATDINPENYTHVSDPHPALDYARYRVIAMDNTTGKISYYDIPGKKVGCTSVIMQWDDTWTNFDLDEDVEIAEPAWSGSMLMLPYDITVSDSNSRDITLVEYAGREHPVSYYGTQLGHQSTWTVNIDKTDKETLYALRRLQRWMGDVYVREPSGSGYWASVAVSFKVSYDNSDLTIPVTFNIDRVEGGM